MANIIKIKTGNKTPTASDLSPSEIGYNKGDNSLYIHDGAQVKKVGSDINMSEIFNAIYPVGSIYMSINSSNPSSIFGGTWVAWGTGRVPVGVNTSDSDFNTVEKIGGSKDLKAHTHSCSTTSNGSHYHSISANTEGAGAHMHEDDFSIATNGSHSHTMNHGHGDSFSTSTNGEHYHATVWGNNAGNINIPSNYYSYWAGSKILKTYNAKANPTLSAGDHSHTINGSVSNYNGSTSSSGSHNHNINGSIYTVPDHTHSISTSTNNSGTHTHSVSCSTDGTGSNNMNPYITCYMWKRTA